MRVKKHRKEGITMKKIGFIGYGLRSETMMKAFTGAGLPLAPAAVADPRLETLQPQLARDGRFADTRYYADAEEMLDPCSWKSPYASMKRSTPGCWPRRPRSEAALWSLSRCTSPASYRR